MWGREGFRDPPPLPSLYQPGEGPAGPSSLPPVQVDLVMLAADVVCFTRLSEGCELIEVRPSPSPPHAGAQTHMTIYGGYTEVYTCLKVSLPPFKNLF